MAHLIQILSTNAWVWLIGYIIGILGFLSAIAFYQKSIRFKQLIYALHGDVLVRDLRQTSSSLEVSYAGKHVGNVTSTKLVFWNRGNETISKDDIAPADPLKIYVADDVDILECHVLVSSSQVNAVKLAKNAGGQVLIDFDYLDSMQGAVVLILHTGLNSECVEFIGTVKGSGPVKKETRFALDDVSSIYFFGVRIDFTAIFIAVTLLAMVAANIWWLRLLLAHPARHIAGEIFSSATLLLLLYCFRVVPYYATIPEVPKALLVIHGRIDKFQEAHLCLRKSIMFL